MLDAMSLAGLVDARNPCSIALGDTHGYALDYDAQGVGGSSPSRPTLVAADQGLYICAVDLSLRG